MSEPNGSAASLLAGTPGSPGELTPPAPTPGCDGGAPPPAGNPPAPPAAGQSWLDSIQDPETKTWAQGKGWKDPADIVGSYKNLEKLLGSEKVPLPKDANDAEGWDRLFKAAGRPDAPEGYGLDKIEGVDPELAKSAAAIFHAKGLSAAQAQGVVEWFGKQSAAVVEAQETAFAQKSQLEMGELLKEWGPASDARISAARQGAQLLGLDEATAAKIERAVGSRALTEMMFKIGEKTGESTFRSGGSQGGDSSFLTPASAAEQKASLLKDPGFAAKIQAGDPAAKSQLDRLQRIAAGLSA